MATGRDGDKASYVALAPTEVGNATELKPRKSFFVACFTSPILKLLCMSWAASVLTVLALTWWSITAYHIEGSEIRHDKGVQGNVYDEVRTFSKQGLAAVAFASSLAEGKVSNLSLPDDDLMLAREDVHLPTGWQAGVIHTWMFLCTLISSGLATYMWLLIAWGFTLLLLTAFGSKKSQSDVANLENRLQTVADIALAMQLLFPVVTDIIGRCTGVEDLGIGPHLYHRVTDLGPLVLAALKVLTLLMNALKEAERSLNQAGDIAWTMCTDSKASISQVKQSAHRIIEGAHILTQGPRWLQRLQRDALIFDIFKSRPMGVAMGIFGFLDTEILKQLEKSLLSLVPSWIEEEIVQGEKKIKEIGRDVDKLRKLLSDHLQLFKPVAEGASGTMHDAVDKFDYAKAQLRKSQKILPPKVVDDLDSVFGKIAVGVNEFARCADSLAAELIAIEKDIQDAGEELVDKVEDILKRLGAVLEDFRPTKILLKLEDLAEHALYGGLVQIMSLQKGNGALPLQPNASAAHA
mmetsp:Transcript_47796/g.86109  ORF Transcript_47796/g.86109 Transcript_47796/m.86109 type:complete len:521 (-) Transcript_47796:138-1700(-)|eukprot:CAMPEP_0197701692 /NCGR_PEP_ID=MMETSP1338-20131121/123564_1 /TAXON_ID=43686 ORGANISM="Pelagodinium beii, Strain RCC1491" /NCGR_SAMPLE_ID=MMETSP1338 /ASSEMBLY_ACC=CAM_ASM_000754 /LENGTH=520 /DNA_ID=CAMNT_0043285419 /DNA_START=27 /DNA_END=1589 /DNA_ORIENTATION=-